MSPGTEPQARASVDGRRRDRTRSAINLARRPFANMRPIQRLGIALWAVGGVLVILAAVLFWRSLFGIEGKEEELARVERQITDERQRVEAAESVLRRMNLRLQNLEATYLNDRIAERTFPWSVLFEDLADVLPREVRLYSLAPQSAGRVTRRANQPAARGSVPGQRRVYLQMTGAAESDEALLALLDNLFASPYFDSPSLPRETLEGNTIKFALSVYYLPDAQRAASPLAAGGGAAEGEVEELAPEAADAGEGRP